MVDHVRQTSPRALLAAASRGVGASAAGTLAMDLFLYRRYRSEGGRSGFPAWESSAGIDSWEQAPAPARAAKRLFEATLRRELSPKHVRAVNNATHWAYGLLAGVPFGLFAAPARPPGLLDGAAFGAAVCASGYVILPVLGVYRPIWAYDVGTLAADLRGHLVFGLATAGAYRAIAAARPAA
jgi:hypothetical protein